MPSGRLAASRGAGSPPALFDAAPLRLHIACGARHPRPAAIRLALILKQVLRSLTVSCALKACKPLQSYTFVPFRARGRVHLLYGETMTGNAPSALSWERESFVTAEIGCVEAAALLGVDPATLVHWSDQHAFPEDVGGAGARRYRRGEIEALCETLPSAHSVLGAIRAARVHFHR
jgi:hypothetical protein